MIILLYDMSYRNKKTYKRVIYDRHMGRLVSYMTRHVGSLDPQCRHLVVNMISTLLHEDFYDKCCSINFSKVKPEFSFYSLSFIMTSWFLYSFSHFLSLVYCSHNALKVDHLFLVHWWGLMLDI